MISDRLRIYEGAQKTAFIIDYACIPDCFIWHHWLYFNRRLEFHRFLLYDNNNPTTVGYKEIHDLSLNGRIFTIFLLIIGVGTVLYSLGTGAQIILEGKLNEIFGRKRLEKKIKGTKESLYYLRIW